MNNRVETLERIAQSLSNEAELLFDLGHKEMAGKIWEQVYNVQYQVKTLLMVEEV